MTDRPHHPECLAGCRPGARCAAPCWCHPKQTAPVADHAFEGDGQPNASICSCGRYREEHLRFG